MRLADQALRLAASQVNLALGYVDAVTAAELRDVLARLQVIRADLALQASDGVHLTFDDDERATYPSRPLSLRCSANHPAKGDSP